MSEHGELESLIPDYVAGRLDDVGVRRLELHLAGCGACEGLVVAGEAVAAELRRAREPETVEHPPPRALRELAAGATPLGAPSIERHLERCETCRLELAVWRAESPESGAPAPSERWAPWRVFAAGIAAGWLVALALWAMAVGRVPSGSPVAWDGPAEIVLLEDPRRGAPPEFVVGGAQPLVALAVHLPLGSADTRDYRLRILDRDGAVRWQHQVSAEAIRSQQERTLLFGLLVPVEALQEGDRVLQVAPAGDDDPAAVREYPFRILRSS